MVASLSEQFEEMRTWADIYHDIDLETKKMILSRIMKHVKVSLDYEIEIEFTVDFEQIGGHEFLQSCQGEIYEDSMVSDHAS